MTCHEPPLPARWSRLKAYTFLRLEPVDVEMCDQCEVHPATCRLQGCKRGMNIHLRVCVECGHRGVELMKHDD